MMANHGILGHLLPVLCMPGYVFAGGDGPGRTEREAEGDRKSKLAAAAFEKSVEAWTQVERYALKAGDPEGVRRARLYRARLAITLGDSAQFRSLRTRLGAARPTALPVSIPDSFLRSREGLESELAELARFLKIAGRAYFRSSEREARDIPLLFEALALAERLVGDRIQAGADEDYRKALAALGGAPPGAARIAAEVRLRYRLRDLDGARRALTSQGFDETELPRQERIAHLRIVRELSRFAGDDAASRELTRRIVALGATEEEQPELRLPFRDFVRGDSAVLERVSAALVAVAREARLDERERGLARYLAGAAALESGRSGEAIEILSGISLQGEAEGVDPHAWLRSRIHVRLAVARQRVGDYEGALTDFLAAERSVASLEGVEATLDRIHLNAGGVLVQLGDLRGAGARARAILSRSQPDPELVVAARLLLGDVSYHAPASSAAEERRNATDALEAYRSAEASLDAARAAGAGSVDRLAVQTSIHQGNACRKLAALEDERERSDALRRQAIAAARDAQERAEGRRLPRLEAVAAANLGELHLEAGDLDAAREHALRALELARETGHFETEWRARWYLARVADARGDEPEAERAFAQAAEIIESHRSRILSSGFKAGFMSTKQSFFESLIDRLLKKEEPREAFAAAERARSRAFIESLGLRLLLFASGDDRQLYREYVGLLGRLESARREPGAVFGVRDDGRRSYAELRNEVEKLRDRILVHPKVSRLVQTLVAGEPASLAQTQQRLASGEVLVEYVSTGDRLAAFCVSGRELSVFRLAASPRTLERQLRAFLDGGAGDPSLARELYSGLVEPLAARVRELGRSATPKVIVVPWGPLHRLPFEALLDGDRHLVEKWELAYLPSATILKYLPRPAGKTTAPKSLVALVDPDTDYDGDGRRDYPALPFAKVEVESIAPYFERAVILAEKRALEEACTRQGPTGEVVHLACHGEFFPHRPLDSTLYLGRGGASDGKLRAVEIFGMDLRRSRLITLSGCETGRMDVAPGDDPVGIGTAFLHSGARALLVSLWKVEDEATAALMAEFYRRWLRSEDGNRARALREAKLHLLREGRFVRPAQWAAFVLIGLR